MRKTKFCHRKFITQQRETDRQTDRWRGRGRVRMRGRARQDWQVMHNVETDGRRDIGTLRGSSILGDISQISHSHAHSHSLDRDRDRIRFRIFPGSLLRLQKSSTRPGAKRHRKEIQRKQSTVSHTLYYTLYSNRGYSLPLRLSRSTILPTCLLACSFNCQNFAQIKGNNGNNNNRNNNKQKSERQ